MKYFLLGAGGRNSLQLPKSSGDDDDEEEQLLHDKADMIPFK